MNNDKTTGELLNVLHSTHSAASLKAYREQYTVPEDTLAFDTEFSRLLEHHHLSKADVIRRSSLDRTYAYQLLNGTRAPGRDKAIILSIAAGLSLKETQRLLTRASEGILYARSSRDSIIIYCIEHGLDLLSTNEMLEDANEEILK